MVNAFSRDIGLSTLRFTAPFKMTLYVPYERITRNNEIVSVSSLAAFFFSPLLSSAGIYSPIHIPSSDLCVLLCIFSLFFMTDFSKCVPACPGGIENAAE